MLVTRYNPTRNFREFRRGFDILNSMLDEFNTQSEDTFMADFTPAVNTREGEAAYHVEVDLPGMKKEDINIQIEDNKLIISGERKVKESSKRRTTIKSRVDLVHFPALLHSLKMQILSRFMPSLTTVF